MNDPLVRSLMAWITLAFAMVRSSTTPHKVRIEPLAGYMSSVLVESCCHAK